MSRSNELRGGIAPCLLMILACVGSLLFAYQTPIGESPDEPAHLARIQTHVDPSTPSSFWSYEEHQPPLYYRVAVEIVSVLRCDDLAYNFVADPRFGHGSPWAFLPAPNDELEAQRCIRHLRSVGAIFSMLTAGLCYLIARRRLDSEWLAAGAAATFALSPQLLAISGAVSNDGLVTLLSTASFLFMMLCEETPSLARGLAAGLFLCLALFTKTSAIFLLAPLTLLIFRTWRDPRVRAALIFSLSVAALLCLLPNIPGFAGYAADRHETTNPALLVQQWEWIPQTWLSFWGKFGWFTINLPWWLYSVFLLPTALVADTIIQGRQWIRRDGKAILAATSVFAMAAAFLGYLALVDFQYQGRLLFPAIGPLVFLAADSISRRFDQRHANSEPLVGMTLLAIYGGVALFASQFV